MFTTEKRSREVPKGRVTHVASTSSPGPKWGEAGRGPGGGAAVRRRWVRRGCLAEFYSTVQLGAPPTISLQRNMRQLVGFGMVFCFLRDLSRAATGWAAHAPRRRGSDGGASASSTSRTSRRLRSATHLSAPLSGASAARSSPGQWSSSAATACSLTPCLT